MAYSISTAAANTVLDTLLTNFANGVIEVRDGVRPIDSDTAATGVVLATIPLGATPFNAAALRSAALATPVSDLTGDANGSATWFRMYDNAVLANSSHILDGDVGIVGSGADMELNDNLGGTAITTADKVTVDTMAVSV